MAERWLLWAMEQIYGKMEKSLILRWNSLKYQFTNNQNDIWSNRTQFLNDDDLIYWENFCDLFSSLCRENTESVTYLWNSGRDDSSQSPVSPLTAEKSKAEVCSGRPANRPRSMSSEFESTVWQQQPGTFEHFEIVYSLTVVIWCADFHIYYVHNIIGQSCKQMQCSSRTYFAYIFTGTN